MGWMLTKASYRHTSDGQQKQPDAQGTTDTIKGVYTKS